MTAHRRRGGATRRRPQPSGAVKGERGAALLAALAGLAALGAIAAAALPPASGAVLRAGMAVERAAAERVAEAAIHRAIAALASPSERARLPRDGTVLETRFLGARLRLWAQDAGGLVDLAGADAATLAGLAEATGAPRAQAARIAEALLAARQAALSAGRPAFASPEAALDAVAEADRAVLAAALPYATVGDGRPTVDLWTAPAPALAAASGAALADAQAFVARRAALGRAAGPPGFPVARLGDDPDTPRTRITATVETDAGGRATVSALVEATADPSPRWRILAWR
jgi:hypothetical protein